MRIDRSRIRIVSPFTDARGDFLGLSLSYGIHTFDAWGLTPRSNFMLQLWSERRFESGSDDEAEVLGWTEDQFLTEELPKLSAHQRIAMIRDGLLIPELPHPGS